MGPEKLELVKYLVGAILASSALTSIFNHLLSRYRNKAEVKKIEAEAAKLTTETELSELDIDEKYMAHKKIQLAELLIEVMALREEVKSSRGEIASLKQYVQDLLEALGNKELDECINIENCAMKITKRQQLRKIKPIPKDNKDAQ